MKSRAFLLLLVPIFLVACAALAGSGNGDDEHEASIEFKQAPEAVRSAIRKVTNIDAITELEQITREGISVYEVEYKRGDKSASLTVAASGEVIESEIEVSASQLPKAVRDAIAKKFPGAKIIGAEAVTFHVYDVVVETKNGKRRGIEILASGHFDDDDDDDDE